MSQMKVVFATASCMVQVGPGNNIQIQEGDIWRASDPVVRAHRDLFTDDPRAVLKTSVPYDESEDGASYADAPSREEVTQHLHAERARTADLERELARYRTAADAESEEGNVSKEKDAAEAPPYEGYRTEAELARAKAESEEGVSEEAPVEGYKTKAQAAKAEAESEEGVSAEAPVDGYKTKAEAARAKAESEEDVASVEPQAPVEQATRAPGEKRTTRRNRA